MKQLWQQLVAISFLVLQFTTMLVAIPLHKSLSLNGLDPDIDDEINSNGPRFLGEAVEHHLRPEVDPCVDFYQYACGNWAINHKNLSNSMALGEERVNRRYESLFEDEIHSLEVKKLKESLVYRKMKQYYSVCKASAEQTSFKLYGYYEPIAKMPFWYPDNFTWLQAFSYLTRFGFHTPFIKVAIVRQNVSSIVLFIEPSPKKINRHDKINTAILTPDIYDILKKYTKRNYSELWKGFKRIDEDLYNMVEDMPNDEDEWLEFSQLEEKLPEIDWQSFLSSMLGRKMRPDEKLNIEAIQTIKNMVQYLNQSNNELISLYTLTRFLNFIERQPRSPLMQGEPASVCIRNMKKVLYVPMLYLYDRAFYSISRVRSDRLIFKVFEALKTEFNKTLIANKMNFTPNVVKFLQKKLKAIRLNLGNLPLNVDQQFYEDYVANLQVSSNFYANHLHAMEHFFTKQILLIDINDADKENPWQSFNNHSPDMEDNVDATPYYYISQNIIIVPFAYLQAPFYNEDFWVPFLFGDLANTLGHEILHSFDNIYLDYDEMGNSNDEFHLQMKNNTNYRRNIECLSKPSTLYLNERIADISGTRLALNTFMKDPDFRSKNGKLYFLQFSQFFCSQDDDVDERHDQGNVRLNYTLAQMPEFAEVFGCPAGSPMNPNERCEHW